MFKEYLDGLRKEFDSIEFKYNHDALYLTVRLQKGSQYINCVINHSMLSDEAAMIEEIETCVKLAKAWKLVS